MSQRLTTSFINTSVPGAYVDVQVKSTPVGVGASGIVAIIGEAAGGADFSSEDLKNNFFTPDQLDSITKKYVSGPIVDAFRALSAPSSDTDITGSATAVYVLKTNSGSKASSALPSYGSLSAKNYGIAGNKYFYQITEVQSEAAPVFSGTTITNFAALAGAKFSISLSGGAASVINVFTGLPATYDTIAEAIALLQAAVPVGVQVSAGAAANSIKIELAADPAALASGHGRSFELIETDAGDLAALGLVAGLYKSATEPKIQIDIKRTDTGTNESLLAEASIALEIGYAGSSATASIASGILITTVSGGAGTSLTVNLSEYHTLRDLAAFIASQTGYKASASAGSENMPTSVLDSVSSVGICSASQKPGRIKRAVSSFQKAMSQSSVLNAAVTASKGLPSETASATFLSGGAVGSTSSASIVNATTALESLAVNFVIPLFSRDATADIVEGLTDSSSAYTIDAVNAAVKSHVLKMSSAKLKKHRIAMLSYWSDFATAKAEASSLSNARVCMCIQKASQVSSDGSVVSYLPWYAAVIAAGMQAAGFYKGITNKFANVISFQNPAGFDANNFGDAETALEAGLLFLESSLAGNRWVSDQTTYGLDSNFVYNSLQAMYAADLVSLDLAASFQNAFVGKSLADVTPAVALSFMTSKMDSYKKQKLIAASDDAPLGFKNAKVSIKGPVMEVAVEIKLATTIYFIPISLTISQVEAAA